MNGSSWTRTQLKRLTDNTSLQVLYLMGLGFLVVVLQANFRLPLQLHGRHGLEWIALLLLGRLSVEKSWSGSVVGISAAASTFLPWWSFKDPLMPLLYLLPGLLVDLAFRVEHGWQRSWWFLALLGGAVHLSKPLVRVLAAASLGLQYGFIKDGLLYGLMLHFVFGAIGGLISFLYVLGGPQKQPSQKNHVNH